MNLYNHDPVNCFYATELISDPQQYKYFQQYPGCGKSWLTILLAEYY
jgi:hypothetical protein